MIYRDWKRTPSGGGTITLGTFHLPGIGKVTSPAAGEDPIYVHTDHLGTTRLITDNTETGGNPDPKIIYASIFSAFGEVVSIDPDGEGTTYSPGTDQPDRYGYVGAHGYQAHTWHDDDTDWFPFQHVGARYYDPSTGRFLQRDPIGVSGGLNLYGYVGSNPLSLIDSNGLVPDTNFWFSGSESSRPELDRDTSSSPAWTPSLPTPSPPTVLKKVPAYQWSTDLVLCSGIHVVWMTYITVYSDFSTEVTSEFQGFYSIPVNEFHVIYFWELGELDAAMWDSSFSESGHISG
jgi:RHS repeat-associated protein